MMAPKDIDKLIEKYLAGDCTKEECDLVDTWYASLGNRNPAGQPPANDRLKFPEDRILKKIHARTGRHVAGNRSWYYTGIAASVFVCCSAAYFLFTPNDHKSSPMAVEATTPEFSEVRNTAESPKRVILPDGSIVVMYPQSTISYPNGAGSNVRELFLEGEAYFDVAHDSERPFFVYAGNVITKVLGTSFIVRHRSNKEKTTVSVKTGKVTVYSRQATHKKTVLTPNQEAVYNEATDFLATRAVPEERVNEERKAFTEMHFEETPVPDVLAMLMKTYGIDIVFEKEILSGCVLTSSFFEEGLYDRIDVICTAIGATYKIVDARIVIESNGCNLKPNWQ